MLVRSDIRSGNKDVDAYLQQLEEEVLSFYANNTKQLIRSIDRMSEKISKDLNLISSEQKNDDGTEVELSNKIIDTFLKMIEKADKIVKFIEIADSIYGVNSEKTTTTTEEIKETITTVEEVTVVKPLIEIGENPFEKMIKKVKDKSNAAKT